MWRPVCAPALLILADPFAFTHALGATTITSFKAALLGVALGLALRRAYAWPRDPVAGSTALALGVLTLVTAVTIAGAEFRAPALRETLKAVEYLAVFLLAWLAARAGDGAARALALACGAVALVTGAAALADYAAPHSGIWIGGVAYTRIAGALEGPNQLAAWLGLTLPVAAVELEFVLAASALAGGAAILALTLSRAGAAQALLSVFALAAVRRGPLLRLAAVAALAFALGLGAFALATRSQAGFARIASTSASVDLGGTGSRAILWDAALRMFRAHPLLGVGAGNYELLVQRYGAPPPVRTHANSLYLEALADGGLVLGVATIAVALLPPLLLLRARREKLALAAGIAGLALAAHGLVDDVTFYTKVGQCWWTVAGVAAAIAGGASSAPSTTPGTK